MSCAAIAILPKYLIIECLKQSKQTNKQKNDEAKQNTKTVVEQYFSSRSILKAEKVFTGR